MQPGKRERDGDGAGAGPWRVVRTGDGSLTLAHPRHGQTCHSVAGAWQEARERYARPCRLACLAAERRASELRLLDVGTGLGLNIAAALEAVHGRGATLRVVSLESERGVIERAVSLDPGGEPPSDPPPPAAYLRWSDVVRRSLERALAQPELAARPEGIPLGEEGASLRLLLGDARRSLAGLERGPRFDAVFLDPFSPRVEPDLWSPAFLRSIAERMAPGSWLSTYTVAASVRVALLAAGLRVGPGPAVGTKASGTLASPDRDPGSFDPDTARRLRRRVEALRAGGEHPPAQGEERIEGHRY